MHRGTICPSRSRRRLPRRRFPLAPTSRQVADEVRSGARLLELVAVQDRLRSPGGCPWDAAQTHESLVPYLLEESYELVEALETGDRAHLREELGDLLMQIVFHARIATEDTAEPFSIAAVAGD